MFARYFVEIPIDPEIVERALTDDPRHRLTGIAVRAHHRGDSLLAEVGFGDRVRVARQVSLVLGAPIHATGKTVIPIRWKPTDASGLFPALDADLEIAPLSPDRTQLAISARYDPPFGMIGKVVDRSMLHRVAEATIKDFLDRVADVLIHQAELGEPQDVVAGAD